MTISSTTRKTALAPGNGVTTSFPFVFKTQDSDDVVVYMLEDGEETVVSSADYTVTLNANQNSSPGGSVEFDTAPTSAQSVRITTEADATQETNIQNQSAFNPTVVAEAFDKVTILVQQTMERVGRAFKFRITDTTSAGDVPPVEEGKVLGWAGGAWSWVAQGANDLISSFMQTPVMAASAHAFAKAVDGVLVLPTIAAATALTGKAANVIYRVQGRLAANDGGGGDFYYVPGSSATVDNGITFQNDAGGTGRLIRIRDQSLFDASWWGAQGGATATVNTAAIKATTTAMQAAGGGKLVLTGGSSKTVLIYPTGSDYTGGANFLGAFSSLRNVEIDIPDKVLTVEDTLLAAEFQRVFQFVDVDRVKVNARTLHSSHATHTTDRGFDWFYQSGICLHAEFNVIAVGGYTAVDFARNSSDTEAAGPIGVFNVRVHATDTSYPVSIQNACQGLDLQLWAERPVRSFLNHGQIGRLRAKITSRDPYTQDVLLHTDGQSDHDTSGGTARDWDIDYFRRANSGSVSPVSSYSLALGFRGSSHSHRWRRLKVKAYIESATATGTAPAVFFFAQNDSSVDITLLADMPSITVDDLDMDIYVASASGNNAAVDLFYDSKWDNTVIKRARVNVVVEASANTPTVNMSWTPFRSVIEHNITAPSVLYMNQRPTVTGLNETPFSFNAATPSWKADSADPAIGDGAITCYVTRIFDTVEVDIVLTMGSTTTFGTGPWYFTLAAPYNFNARVTAIGEVLLADSGTTRLVGLAYIQGGTNKIYIVPHTGTTNVGAAVPFTWAQNDSLTLKIRYLRTYA